MSKNVLKKYIVVPLILFCISLSFYFLYLLSFNFTPRMYFYETNVQEVSAPKDDATKTYSFLSKENYLGIVSITPTNEMFRIATGTLVFRIRKKHDQNWIIENRYRISDVFKTTEFPFGFPVQNDSKNQEYIFELSVENSSAVVTENDLSINTIIVRHYFPRSFFITNPIQGLIFFYKKLTQSFATNFKVENFLALFVLPALYLIILSYLEYSSQLKNTIHFLSISVQKVDLVMLGIVFVDLIIQNNWYFYTCFILFVFYLFVQRSQTNQSKLLCLGSLYAFLLSGCFIAANLYYLGNRLSIWSFIFLCACILLLFLPTSTKKVTKTRK